MMSFRPIHIGYFTIIVILFSSFFYYKRWDVAILNGGDPFGYFAYMPAIIIHDDLLTFERTYEAREAQKGKPKPNDKVFVNEVQLPENHVLNKYTCGVAVMASPFFMIAHALADALGYEQNGFSKIYIFSFFVAGLFYVLWGLWLIRKILLHYFEEKEVLITLILFTLGTNLYYFSAFESVMAHSFLFFLYAQLMYSTMLLHEKGNWKSAFLIGLCAGAITAIRPTEIICLIIPFCYGIFDKTSFFEKINFLKTNLKYIALAICSFILAGLPQMIYWKLCTGHFLYYSYEKESFDFRHPRIIDGLFSFSNGWLAYSPIMILALIGVYFLAKSTKWKLVIVLFLPLHIYIIYSWWCWNYINGIGSRPMVETYPLLALGMAAFWHKISDSRWLKYGFSAVGLVAIYLFTSLVWQFNEGIVWPEYANKHFYWHMIGKTKMDWQGTTMYDTGDRQPNISDLKSYKTLTTNTFEDSLEQNFVKKSFEGNYAYRLDKNKEYYNILDEKYLKDSLEGADYIRAEVQFMREYEGHNFWKNSMLVIEWNHEDGKNIKHNSIRLDNKSSRNGPTIWGWEAKVWTKAYFFLKLNKNKPPMSRIKVYVWNTTDNAIFIDNAKVELCKK